MGNPDFGGIAGPAHSPYLGYNEAVAQHATHAPNLNLNEDAR